ncbi:MAG: S1-like domain-containing RNA-binding protein [Cytophagaceae bacterium]
MDLGRFNTLRIARDTPQGFYLVDEAGEEVLLPGKYITPTMKIDDSVDVFIYRDSEDRLVATTETPLVKLHEYAYLKVKAVNAIGAFLDWGLEKDLFVPFREQKKKMEEGFSYPVYVYMDEQTGRLVATSKWERYISKEPLEGLFEQDEVEIFITHLSDLGVNVIINNKYKGLIYHDDVFTFLSLGDRTKGYIKEVKENGNITVSLRKQGFVQLEDSAQFILNKLKEKEGFLALTDNSSPEEIMFKLQMSKKNFKKAIGILYKNRMIDIKEDGIQLLEMKS